MSEFSIKAVKSPSLTDAEVRHRLGRVYSLILSYTAKQQIIEPCEGAEGTRPSTTASALDNGTYCTAPIAGRVSGAER